MNPASHSFLFRGLAVLTLSLLGPLGAGCNPVDPIEGLAGLTRRCVTQESCAPGFVCERGRGVCVLRGGEACREEFEFDLCDKAQGVCAGARRTCVDGVVVASCSAESYGPDYEALETRCDGLDNDCDGHADAWPVQTLSFFAQARLPPPVPPVQSVYESAESRVVPFGAGFLGISASTITTSYQSQQPPRPTEYRSMLRFQPLDAQLQPASAASFVLYSGDRTIQNLELLPFDGGVFLLWTGMQMTLENGQLFTTVESFLARIDVGASAESPAVGIAPRMPPVGSPGGILRGAVSADAQRLLLAWSWGQARGRLFSLDLEPQSDELVLSTPHPEDVSGSYLSRIDVAAHGDAGFVAAWALVPPGTQDGAEASRVQLRFQRLSSSLVPLGDVVGMAGESGSVQDLRVLGDAQAEGAVFAAWQISPHYVPPLQAPPTLRYAWPFTAGRPSSEPMVVDYGTGRVQAGRGATGEVLLGVSRPGQGAALRRLHATGAHQDQTLPLNNALKSFSVLDVGDPDRWTVAYNGYDGIPRLLSLCR